MGSQGTRVPGTFSASWIFGFGQIDLGTLWLMVHISTCSRGCNPKMASCVLQLRTVGSAEASQRHVRVTMNRPESWLTLMLAFLKAKNWSEPIQISTPPHSQKLAQPHNLLIQGELNASITNFHEKRTCLGVDHLRKSRENKKRSMVRTAGGFFVGFLWLPGQDKMRTPRRACPSASRRPAAMLEVTGLSTFFCYN